MTDYYENCRWFLRTGGPDQPYVEVSREVWLQAERDAGFRGGRAGQPATGAWTKGTTMAGVIVYPHEAVPAGAVELPEESLEVTYEWGHQLRPQAHGRWGAVRESFEDNYLDAEARARAEVDAGRRLRGHGTARLVRRRVVRHDWEEVL